MILNKKIKTSKGDLESQSSLQVLRLGSEMDYEQKFDVNSEYVTMEQKQYVTKYIILYIYYII